VHQRTIVGIIISYHYLLAENYICLSHTDLFTLLHYHSDYGRVENINFKQIDKKLTKLYHVTHSKISVYLYEIIRTIIL
jgi:hypothetical protein